MIPKTQRERFEEIARELECDEDEGRFNARLKRIVATGKKRKKKKQPLKK